MEIILERTGKKFNQEWIFRDLTWTIPSGSISAILGRNGSGKSTLLRVIGGNLTPDGGIVRYNLHGREIPVEKIFIHQSMAAPYLEIIEEFTLPEMLRFHFSFKKPLPGYGLNEITELLQLGKLRNRKISQFSSGMKQRVKLILAMASDVPLLLLDEPTMNLDSQGIEWYLDLLEKCRGERTVVICSNLFRTEAGTATNILRIEDFKR